MPTEQSVFIPGINPNKYFSDTPRGRFGRAAAGFGPDSGLSWFHKAGMHGAGAKGGWGGIYPGLGLGPYGLFDFGSYSIGGGRTLAGTAGALPEGFRAQSAVFGRTAAGLYKGQSIRGGAMLTGRLGGQVFMRGIGPAITGLDVYRGYQEGGIMGGVAGGVKSLAMQYAVGVGLRALGVLGLPVAAVGIAGFGGYHLLKAGRERTKRTKRLEMGQPLMDPFGNAATMRQRSLQALVNSQINGRSAFGSEAQLMHIPVLR